MIKVPAERPVLIWFRDDLRLADNPALDAACADGRPVVCLFLLDDETPEIRPLGAAARWWLHQSLESLSRNLEKRGNRLILRRGRAVTIIPRVAEAFGAAKIFWNRRYGAAGGVDAGIERALTQAGVTVESHKASLLFEPDEIRNRAGKPFQVYSAFWRTARGQGEPRSAIGARESIAAIDGPVASEPIESLELLPRSPDWSGSIRAAWTPGEDAAMERLEAFIEDRLSDYSVQREMPGVDGSSMLSPHLRFGEISPFQIWERVSGRGQSAAKFLAEIGWREFAFHLLGQFPALADRNLKSAFDSFPWASVDSSVTAAWQRGLTGYPIVDAGMRQLWQTGWMHNRVRMVAASFLTKHLLVDWRIGETWFWDSLVDADPANNPSNWQWIAGSGADAQPYFRIFNPILQGEKFDPQGHYVRQFVPEIAGLPDRFIHKPWKASPIELASAGIELGTTYPMPIVEHSMARHRALASFNEMKNRSTASRS